MSTFKGRLLWLFTKAGSNWFAARARVLGHLSTGACPTWSSVAAVWEHCSRISSGTWLTLMPHSSSQLCDWRQRSCGRSQKEQPSWGLSLCLGLDSLTFSVACWCRSGYLWIQPKPQLTTDCGGFYPRCPTVWAFPQLIFRPSATGLRSLRGEVVIRQSKRPRATWWWASTTLEASWSVPPQSNWDVWRGSWPYFSRRWPQWPLPRMVSSLEIAGAGQNGQPCTVRRLRCQHHHLSWSWVRSLGPQPYLRRSRWSCQKSRMRWILWTPRRCLLLRHRPQISLSRVWILLESCRTKRLWKIWAGYNKARKSTWSVKKQKVSGHCHGVETSPLRRSHKGVAVVLPSQPIPLPAVPGPHAPRTVLSLGGPQWLAALRMRWYEKVRVGCVFWGSQFCKLWGSTTFYFSDSSCLFVRCF